MTGGDVSDPRAFRWVESGVSGLARTREWDATAFVEAPGHAGGEELTFRAYPEQVVGVRGDVPAVAAATAALDALVDRPYEALLVARGDGTWAAAARAIGDELVRLGDVEATSIELATAPDGARTLRVDGDERLAVDPAVAAAASELERRARRRFEAYAVTADRVESDLWEVRVDPL